MSPFGAVVVFFGDHPPVGPDRHGKHRSVRGDLREATFQKDVNLNALLLSVVFDGEKPRVEDRPKCARRDRRGAQGFDGTTVDRLQLVQRGVDLVDLDLSGCESPFHGPNPQASARKGLAGTVLTANGLEHCTAAGHNIELAVDRRFESAETHRELVKSVGRHRPAAQRVEDLATAARGYRRGHSRTPNCSCSAATLSRTTPAPTWSTS